MKPQQFKMIIGTFFSVISMLAMSFNNVYAQANQSNDNPVMETTETNVKPSDSNTNGNNPVVRMESKDKNTIVNSEATTKFEWTDLPYSPYENLCFQYNFGTKVGRSCIPVHQNYMKMDKKQWEKVLGEIMDSLVQQNPYINIDLTEEHTIPLQWYVEYFKDNGNKGKLLSKPSTIILQN